MADGEVIVKAKIVSDTSGAQAVDNSMKRLIAKANQLSKEEKAAAEKSAGAMERLSRATALARRAMTGFGVAGVFTALTAAVGKIAGSFNAAEKAAGDFAKIQAQLGRDKAIQNLVAEYERLKQAAADAAAAEKESLDAIDEDVRNRRRLEKAKRDAAKEAELSALDPEDLAYEQKKSAIEARYAREEASANVSDAREDVTLRRQRLASEAEGKEAEAKAQDAQSEVLRRRIADAQRAKMAADLGAQELNDADKSGVLDALGKTAGQLFTGQWGRLTGAKTEEGDAIRKEQAQKAAAAELEVGRLKEELRKSEAEAARLRQEAERIRARRDRAGNALDAMDIERETARAAGIRTQDEAGLALERKEAQIAKDRKTVADAPSEIGVLESARAFEEERAAQAAARYGKEAADVVAAQGRYDMLAANGGSRREKSAALAALQQEQREAEEAKHDMERTAAQVATTLAAIKEQINALSRAVKQAQSRLSNSQADAPEG